VLQYVDSRRWQQLPCVALDGAYCTLRIAVCCSVVVGVPFDCVAVLRNVLQTAGVDGNRRVAFDCTYYSVCSDVVVL